MNVRAANYYDLQLYALANKLFDAQLECFKHIYGPRFDAALEFIPGNKEGCQLGFENEPIF